MKTKNNKIKLTSLIALFITLSLACGSVQVGVVATEESSNQPVVEVPATQIIEPDGTDSQPEQVVTLEASPMPEDAVAVTGWLGHIASLPQSTQYDDMLVLSPDGTGELGITGANPEIEAEIRSLRDADGPNEFVHVWGQISCPAQDYNNCQVIADRLQYGANYSDEMIKNWRGTIKTHSFNGGLSYVFELAGDYPMWYSLHASKDETLQEQIAELSDRGAIIEVSGKLMVGVPDVNGSRIEAQYIEVIEAGTVDPPEHEISFDNTADWPVFVNDRYGYQIKYPHGATISLYGPVGFPSDELPAGTSPQLYMDELQKLYTDKLCVSIEYSLGWVNISAPENQVGMYTPCGPTGVGAGELIPKIESVYIGDQLYEANGHEVRLHLDDGSGGILTGETLDMHYETYRIKLDDGTVILYGSLPRHDATYEDYLMKTKEILRTIISTYQDLP
jgi:hypothetical protein